MHKRIRKRKRWVENSARNPGGVHIAVITTPLHESSFAGRRACFVEIGRAGTAVAAVRTTGASSVIRLQRRPVCGLKTGLRQTENNRIKNPTEKKKKGHLLKIVRILGVVKTALPGVLNRGETTVPRASVRPSVLVCVCARTSFTYNVHVVPLGIITIVIIIIIVICVPARAGQWTMGPRRRKTGCPRPRRCATLCPAA